MSRQNYKSSALYEVWSFITRRAQLEDQQGPGYTLKKAAT